MPQLADLVILKADGATNVTWSGIVASAGDKSASRHASKSVSTIPAFQPQMSIRTEANGNSAARRVHVNVVYPYTVVDANTGLTTKVSQNTFRGEWSVSQDIPQATTDEFAAQVANLIDTVLLVDVVKSQTAPT